MRTTLVLLAVAIAATTANAQGNPPPPRPVQPPQNWQQPPQPDPFSGCFFSPEEVMAHQREIGLQDDQRATLASEIGKVQSKATEVQWLLSAEQEKLQQLVRSAKVDEAAVLKQVDRVLSLEQDLKRAQMTLLVRIKNTLTTQQQAGLYSSRQPPHGCG